jgi:hypothetical protein
MYRRAISRRDYKMFELQTRRRWRLSSAFLADGVCDDIAQKGARNARLVSIRDALEEYSGLRHAVDLFYIYLNSVSLRCIALLLKNAELKF